MSLSFLCFNKNQNHPPADFNGKLNGKIDFLFLRFFFIYFYFFLRLACRQTAAAVLYLFIVCMFSFTLGWSCCKCNWCSVKHAVHISPLKKTAFHSVCLHQSYSMIISTFEHDHSAPVSLALCFCTACEPAHGSMCRPWSRLSPHAPLASAGDSFLCKAEGRKSWALLCFKKFCGVGWVFADVLILLS